MKLKINFQWIHRLAKVFATTAALFTLVMSPVAMGREAQKITVKQLQQGLDEAGLNKQVTVGEFYTKNKHLIPPRVQKEFEPFVAAYKNQMMPHFEVIGTKATDGTEVATLRLTQGDEIITMQMLGGEDRYAKIQNTYVSEIDVINFNDMFKRILAGDEKYRKQYEALVNPPESTSKKGTYTGFPDLTVAAWKGMSQKERAAYMINMRLLWNDARRVLIEAEKKDSKGRKTSSNDSMIEKWDNFFAMISPAVKAAPKAVPKVSSAALKGTPVTVKQGAGSSAYVSGSNCIVAGYVSTYTSSKCGADIKSSEGILKSYKNPQSLELINSTNAVCAAKGADMIACNPFVYGTPGGNPICIPTTAKDFQKATHYDGPCENTKGQESKLGSYTSFLKDENKKDGSRYDEENRTLTDAQLEEKYKAEQAANPKMVEDYLNGLLAYKKKAGIDFKQPLTDEMLTELRSIKEAFDNDIKTARESCKLAAANKNNEKNFWGACDQLHRRFLNVAQFLEQTPGCKDGSKINPDSLKCKCSSGVEILPGTPLCSSPQPPPVCPAVPKPDKTDCVPVANPPAAAGEPLKPGEKCEDRYPGAAGLNAQCQCANGQSPRLDVKFGEDGPEAWTCVGVTKKADDKDCGVLCSVGKFFKNNAKLLLGIGVTGVAAFALYKILKPKMPSIKSPGDVCPNGAVAPCVQSCYPKALINGNCACAACPVGQTADSLCNCSTSSSSTTTYKCPDGVTTTTDSTLASCPATKYTCWDGSTVTNVLSCPEKPSTTKSSSGKAQK